MVDKRLIDYVKKAIEANSDENQIRQVLIKNGWKNSEIDKAFRIAKSNNKNKSAVVLILSISSVFLLLLFFVLFNISISITPRNNILPHSFDGLQNNISNISFGNDSISFVNSIVCDNMSCFLSASQNCTPSEMNFTQSSSSYGITETFRYTLRIIGAKEGKCDLYIKTDDITLSFAEGISENVKESEENLLQPQIGLSGSCLFSIADLSSVIEKWLKTKKIESIDWRNGVCSGDFFK